VQPAKQERAWQQIKVSLSELIDLEGLGEDEIMNEVGQLAGALGYSDDDMMDLDNSVMSWLQGG